MANVESKQAAPARCWPGGAHVAVVFQLVFEQWAGLHVEPGRHTVPQLSLDAIKQGLPDLGSLSWQEYAGRAGFYRLMDTVDRHGVKATGLFSGLAVERYPEVAREFAKNGHELAAHSWSEDVRAYRLAEDETRADMRKTRGLIEDVTGCKVAGWSSAGRQSNRHTLAVAASEGFVYVNEFVDDDRPVLFDAGEGRSLVAIAPSFDVNDYQMFARGRNAPAAYIDNFRRQLHGLHADAESGPTLMTAVFHAALLGHPMGAWILSECIREARALEGVLVTTHQACAEHWLQLPGHNLRKGPHHG